MLEVQQKIELQVTEYLGEGGCDGRVVRRETKIHLVGSDPDVDEIHSGVTIHRIRPAADGVDRKTFRLWLGDAETARAFANAILKTLSEKEFDPF